MGVRQGTAVCAGTGCISQLHIAIGNPVLIIHLLVILPGWCTAPAPVQAGSTWPCALAGCHWEEAAGTPEPARVVPRTSCPAVKCSSLLWAVRRGLILSGCARPLPLGAAAPLSPLQRCLSSVEPGTVPSRGWLVPVGGDLSALVFVQGASGQHRWGEPLGPAPLAVALKGFGGTQPLRAPSKGTW